MDLIFCKDDPTFQVTRQKRLCHSSCIIGKTDIDLPERAF